MRVCVWYWILDALVCFELLVRLFVISRQSFRLHNARHALPIWYVN